MDQKQKLAEEVLRWAKQELRVQGVPLPSPEELKFICRHEMVPILQFLQTHVKAESTVQHIKGNLLVYLVTNPKLLTLCSEVEDKLKSAERQSWIVKPNLLKREMSYELNLQTLLIK
jgi:hypothetical protein